jgi:hypothetical protein
VRQLAIDSTIERRVLVNFRVEPTVLEQMLPAPFRPSVVHGWAVGGICLIRLAQVRPATAPRWTGLATENAAHRFGVEWDTPDGPCRGVYIPRRDTDSALTAALGGRVFAGLHERARFDVTDDGERLEIRVTAASGTEIAAVAAVASTELGGVLFDSIDDALGFFRAGPVGYSPNPRRGVLEGMRLGCPLWSGSALRVERIRSSVFDDEACFPPGSCVFDSALVMRDLEAHWRTAPPLRVRDRSPSRDAA